MYPVSSYNKLGVRQLYAGFATEEVAVAFLRNQLVEIARNESRYIVVREEGGWEQKIYLTQLLLGCVQAQDWSGAAVPAE
ncbi:hypothetical protein WOC76_08635 [Methylocystis sp. IM3]|uniref:hypothetical protein n=1 Tax=Methylocystis sp. IM3 TaxID=3136722 RepID=UPI00311A8C6D